MGDKMRYYRRLKGLSQVELAQGICTQATISLIEKRNKVPSMNILMRLIDRLGIELTDVVVENRNSTQKTLNQIDELIRLGQYEQANQLIEPISDKKLNQDDDQKRYYYALGMIELFLHQAPDEAIYYFGRTLTPYVTSDQDLFGIMATLGLGLAYAEKKEFNRAKVYIDQSLQMLTRVPLADTKYLTVELSIYWNISRIYFELRDFNAVRQFSEQGIRIAVQHKSLYLLDELYAIQARALHAAGSADANERYEIALALARVNHASKLAQSLVSEMGFNAPNSETA
ncbi:XRE family transcriptional regulator [Lacticaseibacillus saniviri JCM 17471 = DSM 24301]|uniref:XRE family transcriptional regulator n=2 Tax=Lacticaseibacillus saniviri TaxID=931533 RepID=A0A0R2N3V6_9LACO|nr:XRE family transcriptional regulator [Lacticaseibacillus saniviri JCM 17471 = DSM 24301]